MAERVTGAPRVLDRRTDLGSRRRRLAAAALVRGLDVVERVQRRFATEVVDPGSDRFYTQPPGLDGLTPGEVIDTRSIVVRGFRRPLDADAWQIKFRSTNTVGASVAGVTTLMISRQPFRRDARPLLSYQPAIDSLGFAADPSYTLRQGTQKEMPLIAMALRRGWAVVCTDYTGPTHAFAAGSLAARLVLDGIRAVLAFEPAGLNGSTPLGMWGYSGGAQATLAACEEHPEYAPELKICAAAAGGVPVDPNSPRVRLLDDGGLFTGLAVGTCIGLSREYPSVDLQAVLTPAGRAVLGAAADMTMEQLAVNYPFLEWGDYLTVPSVRDIPGMREALDAIRLGHGTPTVPLYLYHAIRDQNLPIADVDELVAEYRRGEAEVSYRRYRLGEHMIVMGTGARSAIRFLDRHLSGTAQA